MSDRGIKIHPYLPTPLFNRMQERIDQRGITTTAFIVDAIRRVLRDEAKIVEADIERTAS